MGFFPSSVGVRIAELGFYGGPRSPSSCVDLRFSFLGHLAQPAFRDGSCSLAGVGGEHPGDAGVFVFMDTVGLLSFQTAFQPLFKRTQAVEDVGGPVLDVQEMRCQFLRQIAIVGDKENSAR